MEAVAQRTLKLILEVTDYSVSEKELKDDSVAEQVYRLQVIVPTEDAFLDFDLASALADMGHNALVLLTDRKLEYDWRVLYEQAEVVDGKVILKGPTNG